MIRASRLAAFAIVLLAGCGPRATLVVGSKNFTEQIVLGEIVSQWVEKSLNVSVERRLDLGGTMLAHLALVNGDIDLYPEYTGTALSSVLKEPLATDPRKVFETVSGEYQKKYHLRWLPSLGFNDSFAMVIRSDGKGRRVRTLSDAAKASWRLGVGYEFLTRPDGLSQLDRVYNFHWNELPRTMDLGLLYRALRQGQIDMAAGNTTDGILTSEEFSVLSDDRRAFPPYEACLVVRESTLAKVPGLTGALTLLSGKLDDSTMRRLNRRVDIDHIAVARVAADFLDGLGTPRRARSGGSI